MLQLRMAFVRPKPALGTFSYRERMLHLLKGNLDFHGQRSLYGTHGWHSFPAKFPPQLPRSFITELTMPGDLVLDPMMGSGTTLIEAVLLGRIGMGSDIDPLARQMVATKLSPTRLHEAYTAGLRVMKGARAALDQDQAGLREWLRERFDVPTQRFADYWFAQQTQFELAALRREIERIEDSLVRRFLSLAFSSIIITKSGGVSLAKDLAHTRPHRVVDKSPNSALEEFKKRVERNQDGLIPIEKTDFLVTAGDAQHLPFASQSIDLIITSPPYASHAIDYMRAHKFSLIWCGHSISELALMRRKYIGGDAVLQVPSLSMPPHASRVLSRLESLDRQKARALHRYYSEMKAVLSEMHRLLKSGRAAIVVVGTSQMRGLDTETHTCLGEIGETVGFELVHIGTRRLDRDKRMMPARWNTDGKSQIEARMHEEYVIGLCKPEGPK